MVKLFWPTLLNHILEVLGYECVVSSTTFEGLDKEEEYIKELDRLKEGLMKQFAVNKLLKDKYVRTSPEVANNKVKYKSLMIIY